MPAFLYLYLLLFLIRPVLTCLVAGNIMACQQTCVLLSPADHGRVRQGPYLEKRIVYFHGTVYLMADIFHGASGARFLSPEKGFMAAHAQFGLRRDPLRLFIDIQQFPGSDVHHIDP